MLSIKCLGKTSLLRLRKIPGFCYLHWFRAISELHPHIISQKLLVNVINNLGPYPPVSRVVRFLYYIGSSLDIILERPTLHEGIYHLTGDNFETDTLKQLMVATAGDIYHIGGDSYFNVFTNLERLGISREEISEITADLLKDKYSKVRNSLDCLLSGQICNAYVLEENNTIGLIVQLESVGITKAMLFEIVIDLLKEGNSRLRNVIEDLLCNQIFNGSGIRINLLIGLECFGITKSMLTKMIFNLLKEKCSRIRNTFDEYLHEKICNFEQSSNLM